jgi:hypothetical protein
MKESERTALEIKTMDKLTDSQKKKALEARKEILALQEKCDHLFNSMVKELGYEDLLEQWENEYNYDSPVGWLFDLVYNATTDSDVESHFEAIDRVLDPQKK